jgi:hypothetical protein
VPIGEQEPLELCEECGSPLEDGACLNCSRGFREGASPVGATPLDRGELSRILGRSVGARAHGSYALSMQQEEGMAPLRRQIDLLVERFNASAEVKLVAKQSAERLAVKILQDLGPSKAAIASVAQVFIGQGRNLAEVSFCISMRHPAMERLRDLLVEVYPSCNDEIRVLVDGRNRPFKSYSSGIYRKLRISLFASDDNALVELRNGRLIQDGYDARRVEPLGPSEFRVKTDERSFGLFKVMEEARLSGKAALGAADPIALLRKYSVSKLPLTQRLLREARLLQQVTGEYARLYSRQVGNGHGRSPRKLAEEALIEACVSVVPPWLSGSISRKYHLKQSGMRSLLVLPELAGWQG